MYLLMTDETNVRAGANARFFAYGGLVVPLDKLSLLSRRIQLARVAGRYRPSDVLKFDTNTRPRRVSHEDATATKRRVIRACIAAECRFIAYVVLHAIARNRDPATLVQWGANTVLSKFDNFLVQERTHGIVQVDRLPNNQEYGYLSEKFTRGLTFQDEEARPLERVLLLGSTCINASHVASAMDIVLGSFRYCINAGPTNEAAREMMLQLTQLIWAERDGDELDAMERGLVFRPLNVRREDYRQEYENLLAHINGLLAEQEE